MSTRTPITSPEHDRPEPAVEPRIAVFILDTVTAADGGYVPCIAKEGERGYYRTDWNWGTDRSQAIRLADEYNKRLGISQHDAVTIQISTMRTTRER